MFRTRPARGEPERVHYVVHVGHGMLHTEPPFDAHCQKQRRPQGRGKLAARGARDQSARSRFSCSGSSLDSAPGGGLLCMASSPSLGMRWSQTFTVLGALLSSRAISRTDAPPFALYTQSSVAPLRDPPPAAHPAQPFCSRAGQEPARPRDNCGILHGSRVSHWDPGYMVRKHCQLCPYFSCRHYVLLTTGIFGVALQHVW